MDSALDSIYEGVFRNIGAGPDISSWLRDFYICTSYLSYTNSAGLPGPARWEKFIRGCEKEGMAVLNQSGLKEIRLMPDRSGWEKIFPDDALPPFVEMGDMNRVFIQGPGTGKRCRIADLSGFAKRINNFCLRSTDVDFTGSPIKDVGEININSSTLLGGIADLPDKADRLVLTLYRGELVPWKDLHKWKGLSGLGLLLIQVFNPSPDDLRAFGSISDEVGKYGWSKTNGSWGSRSCNTIDVRWDRRG